MRAASLDLLAETALGLSPEVLRAVALAGARERLSGGQQELGVTQTSNARAVSRSASSSRSWRASISASTTGEWHALGTAPTPNANLQRVG